MLDGALVTLIATLTSSGVSKGSRGRPSLHTSAERMSTMCAPLSMSAFTGRGSVGPSSKHFHMKWSHFSGGLTRDMLLSKDCSSSRLDGPLLGKSAATRELADGSSLISSMASVIVATSYHSYHCSYPLLPVVCL